MGDDEAGTPTPSGRRIPVPAPMLRRLVAAFDRDIARRAPLTLQLLGRILLHAAAVGAAVGVVSVLFVLGLEVVQYLVLELLAGYKPLRAAGEGPSFGDVGRLFHPWLLLFIPAIGALASGLVSTLAPEIRGGGSDAIIETFHHKNGVVRRRVPILKVIASVFTLGFGGSGGREGPTMQIGGSIGSVVGRYLRVSERERRILLVAGAAAGMAAVFRTPLRTPLGAALLAVEVLHKNDFESDALVPSVLASVVSYSVFIALFGGGLGADALFAHAPKYPFVPAHLWLYAIMAFGICACAASFVAMLHRVKALTEKLPLPLWAKPAIGGLALGVLAVPIIYFVGSRMGEGQGLGVLGGGYGAAQVAITGASWFPGDWRGVQLLLLLGFVKMIATALTVGSGGSAGDFGPSMVMGGIFGGAFGRAAQLLLDDPRIDPGAFALVGMGTFYGGLAHVPIGSLVMTCELAGSYDLLVPLMLAEGIAFVGLRNRSLYKAQVDTKRDSPAHRDDLIIDVLKDVRVGAVVIGGRDIVSFGRKTTAAEVLRKVAAAEWQDAFPVLEPDGTLVGVVTTDILRAAATEPDVTNLAVADDMMAPPVFVREDDDLHKSLELMLAHGMRELLVIDANDRVIGVVDEAEITAAYLAATTTRKG
jgi:chloride channel protein, CIC family